MDNQFVNAIDNHNVANGDESWFEKKINATGELISDVAEGITKGGVGTVVAGVNSILNTGIAMANFVGGDIEPIDTYQVMKGLDDDLGQYYKEHKTGIELSGFVAGSLIPGTAGVKAVQAAKAGVIGSNMAKSTSLMTSLTYDYAKAAKLEFAAKNSPFTIFDANVIKSLAQGTGAAAIDAGAFEVAATAGMYKSPMLDEQSSGDLFWNIATGVAIGGGLGAVFHGVKTVYGIKKGRVALENERFPYRNITELDDTATPEMKIMNYFNDKLSMPEAKLADGVISDLDPASRLKLVTDARTETLERLDVLIREQFLKFSGNDPRISEQLFKNFQNVTNIADVTAAMLHTKGATRITSSEGLAVGEVLFPKHGISKEEFSGLVTRGAHGELFVDTATKTTQGFKVIGDIKQLKIISSGEKAADDYYLGNKDAAFAAGYDVYRNANGNISINPASSILQSSAIRRIGSNLIVDFESGGKIVDKATAGLADIATAAKPIVINGDTVLAGELNPIKINPKDVKFNPVEGSHLDVQARYIHAMEQKGIQWRGKVVGENDLPWLQRAYIDADLSKGFVIQLEDGTRALAPTGEQLRAFIENKQASLANKMNGKSLDEIGYRLNTSDKYLNGEDTSSFIKIKPGVDYNIPRYGKIDYEEGVKAMEMYDASKLGGAIEYEYQKKLIENRHSQNFANYAKELDSIFPPRPNWSDPGRTPTTEGAGASLLGFANSNYGSAGGWAQVSGMATNRLKVANLTKTITPLNDAISPVIQLGKDATAETALINNRLLQSGEAWVQHPNNPLKMIPRKDYIGVMKGGKYSEEITVSSSQVMDWWKTHANINNERQVHWKNLKGTAGVGDDMDLAVFYPIPVDTTKLKHFVIIKPRGINFGDKSRVIAAKDETTLGKLVEQVDSNEFDVITKKDTERWHQAIGDYDFAKGMNESAVDSSLKREGKLSQHFPTINENFFQRAVEWHTRQSEMLSTAMVEHKYSQAFMELQHLGEQYTNLATSQFRSLTEALVEKVKDPYNDIRKTALDISRAGEYQWYRSFNETVKDAIEKPISKLRETFRSSEKIDQAFVDKVNQINVQLGSEPAFKGAAQILLANGNIPNKPWLAQFIAGSNGIMSTTLLQWDFMNAVNNVVSNPILQSAEFKFLLDGINKADARTVGKLSDWTKVKLPDGSGLEVPTVGKLTMKAMENLVKDDGTLLKRFQEIGVDLTLIQQERMMRQALTIDYAKATSSQAMSALEKAAEFGRKWTGNNLAEASNRFVAADIARQIVDRAVEVGILRDVKEANEYIQLAVSKTQGNYLHSQRPIVFQGVVGQAISLFQTYQFNLMQQMFKYVGEGDGKAVAMLMGLQGAVYGMQGLPAFNFLNTHIVGNASGNTNHRDLYTASKTVFGQDLGNWMLYGAGSNALGLIDSSARFNLYSRGDINPRQLTVLPTQISDIPIIAASVGFVKNLWSAGEKISKGGALWPTLSQALEHNGLSRPLAGLAQTVQGYTTTNQGSLLTSSQDFWNIATLSRVTGAKPFDESVALDALYRINAYRAKDLSRIQELGSAMKTTVVGGGTPTEEQVVGFAKEYAKSGGKIGSFNRFMSTTMINANQSQVNKMAQHLDSPFARQLQIIMGGQPLPDFMNQPAQVQ